MKSDLPIAHAGATINLLIVLHHGFVDSPLPIVLYGFIFFLGIHVLHERLPHQIHGIGIGVRTRHYVGNLLCVKRSIEFILSQKDMVIITNENIRIGAFHVVCRDERLVLSVLSCSGPRVQASFIKNLPGPGIEPENSDAVIKIR